LDTATHLFTTPRLGFRTWTESDLPAFAAMNSDPEIMRFFQKPLSKEESTAMMERMNRLFEDKGYCYFAVDLLETGELVGMIGLGWKTFEASFTPCVDIGWRIRKEFWNQGLTTEGAQACLDFAKEKGIPEVLSMASLGNLASLRVMQKIGMRYWQDFDHPELIDHPAISRLSLYRIYLG
jgi:RimJ/RimL family protein N-acetyltransferase